MSAMKTDDIRTCMRVAREHGINCGGALDDFAAYGGAVIELSALEADNARKDEAIRELLAVLSVSMQLFVDNDLVGELSVAAKAAGVSDGFGVRAKTALTGAPSGAFVTLEELTTVSDTLHSLIGLGERMPLGDVMYLIGQLAAKIKEAENA